MNGKYAVIWLNYVIVCDEVSDNNRAEELYVSNTELEPLLKSYDPVRPLCWFAPLQANLVTSIPIAVTFDLLQFICSSSSHVMYVLCVSELQ